MRIVITGASGNVGTGLLRVLADAPERHQVLGLCRRPPPRTPPYDLADWVAVDLAEPQVQQRLAELFRGADAVVHLAWAIQPERDPAALHRVNVDGTRAVLAAAGEAGVPHVVHAASLAVYGPAAPHEADESWPATGLASSRYSRQKIAAEALLDNFAARHPETTVTSLRPTLVLQRAAAGELATLFGGPLVRPATMRLLTSRWLPVLPLPSSLRVRLVHAEDLGRAVLAILERGLGGPVNVAAPDVLTPATIAGALRSRALPVSARLLRPLAALAFRLRLVRAAPGWLDVAVRTPVLDPTRARTELDWTPRHTGLEALEEVLGGLVDGVEGDSAALRRDRYRRPAETGRRELGSGW